MAKIINIDGTVDIISPPDGSKFTLDDITTLVDGIVEFCFFKNVCFFYNKHGHILNMPANQNATVLLSYPISGICLVIESSELSSPFFTSDYNNDSEKQIEEDEYSIYTKTFNCIFNNNTESEIKSCKRFLLPNNITLDMSKESDIDKFVVVLNSLLEFFLQREEYEKCQKINNICNFYKKGL